MSQTCFQIPATALPPTRGVVKEGRGSQSKAGLGSEITLDKGSRQQEYESQDFFPSLLKWQLDSWTGGIKGFFYSLLPKKTRSVHLLILPPQSGQKRITAYFSPLLSLSSQRTSHLTENQTGKKDRTSSPEIQKDILPISKHPVLYSVTWWVISIQRKSYFGNKHHTKPFPDAPQPSVHTGHQPRRENTQRIPPLPSGSWCPIQKQ